MSSLSHSSPLDRVSAELLDRLACPRCRGEVHRVNQGLHCAKCNQIFKFQHGVLSMIAAPVSGDGGCQDCGPAASEAAAPPRRKPLDYERRRFGSRSGRKRDAFERLAVERFLGRHPPGQWVLDVPSGTGRLNPHITRRGKVVSVDRDVGRASRALHREDSPSTIAIQGDALSLPFRDDAFDLALCVRLTHHLDEERLTLLLTDLGRVAKELLVTYYNHHSLKNLWRIQRNRMRGDTHRLVHTYSPSRFGDIARRAGLRPAGHTPKLGLFHHPLRFLRLHR